VAGGRLRGGVAPEARRDPSAGTARPPGAGTDSARPDGAQAADPEGTQALQPPQGDRRAGERADQTGARVPAVPQTWIGEHPPRVGTGLYGARCDQDVPGLQGSQGMDLRPADTVDLSGRAARESSVNRPRASSPPDSPVG